MNGKSVRRACAAVCAISSIAWAVQAEAAASPPMAFNWGEHLEAGVKAVETKTSAGQQIQLEATYSLCARRTAKGYEIGFANLLVMVAGKRMPDQLARTMAITGGLVPYANISSAGKFEGLRGFEQIQAHVREVYRQKIPPGADPEATERALAQMTTRQYQEANATESWQSLVGTWAGLTLAPGGTMKTHSRHQTIFGLPIAHDITLSYPTREACTSGAAMKDCARLHSISESDPHAFDATIEKLRAQAQRPKGEIPLGTHLRDEVDLITEPATLRPHSARWSRTLSVTTGDKEHPTAKQQSDTTTMSFEYTPQAACKSGKEMAP